jgi:hypothetical protein
MEGYSTLLKAQTANFQVVRRGQSHLLAQGFTFLFEVTLQDQGLDGTETIHI